MALIRDLKSILRPDQFSIKGKIGFEEPHYTGWLAALANSIHYSCQNTFIDLEPVFEDEYFALESTLRGRLRLGLILIKVGWFFFINWVRNSFVWVSRKSLDIAASIE